VADAFLDRVRDLLAEGITAAPTTSDRAVLQDAVKRLGEPLRVAIAGKVKAGKSTLLNALVGEELAPTDAGECTRIVSWYRHGQTYQVLLYPVDGPPEQTRFQRNGGALDVDLAGHTPQQLDHLEVWWPSARLVPLTLIDMPGTASISADISARTEAALLSRDERPAVADAVIYLMRHLHAADMRFLESFHDDAESGPATPTTAVGVLSRADEIGACRLGALDAARRVAARYESEPALKRFCQVVVPVAGLLAQVGATLREDEFAGLARLAVLPRGELAELLLTADRFTTLSTPQLTAAERAHVLARLGLFGVRVSTELIRSREVASASDLAVELTRLSGVNRLRRVLLSQFAERSRVLKARSALAALQATIRAPKWPDRERFQEQIALVTTNTHEFVEVDILDAARAGELHVLQPPELDELQRLLGGTGVNPAVRLGLPSDADAAALRTAAITALRRWRGKAERPLRGQEYRGAQEAARVVVRTCEGIVAALPSPGR